MFVITCQKGENYGLGNNADPRVQIAADDFGNVLYSSHDATAFRCVSLGRYKSSERAREISAAIIAKPLDDIRNFHAMQLNRYSLPTA